MTGEAQQKSLIVILGPTAVGKTACALQLAAHVQGEIIGADSRQIYRFMDIGTAKPTPAEMAQVPHHLIDIINPDEYLSLADYQAQAYAAIQAVHARGHVPLLVGGTGQYITAVVEGWSIPKVPPNFELRTELEARAEREGAHALHQILAQEDPEAAEKIHPNNVRRVVRALEVFLETGVPITELQRKSPPNYHIRQYGFTLERDTLYARADQRVLTMFHSGFVEEVRSLLERGYKRQLPSMSGLGYREIAAYLNAEIPLQSAIEQTQLNTHDFIRRQYTWFRGHDDGILWWDVGKHTVTEFVADVHTWLAG